GELVWALPRLANRLSCELRPTGCHFVNAERLAELARSLVGLSGEPELSPTGLRFCLDATSPARQGLPLPGHQVGCSDGCNVRPEDTAVIDIGFSGFVHAATRPATMTDASLSRSLPVLASRVRTELKAAARKAGVAAWTTQLFTSEALL